MNILKALGPALGTELTLSNLYTDIIHHNPCHIPPATTFLLGKHLKDPKAGSSQMSPA